MNWIRRENLRRNPNVLKLHPFISYPFFSDDINYYNDRNCYHSSDDDWSPSTSSSQDPTHFHRSPEVRAELLCSPSTSSWCPEDECNSKRIASSSLVYVTFISDDSLCFSFWFDTDSTFHPNFYCVVITQQAPITFFLFSSQSHPPSLTLPLSLASSLALSLPLVSQSLESISEGSTSHCRHWSFDSWIDGSIDRSANQFNAIQWINAILRSIHHAILRLVPVPLLICFLYFFYKKEAPNRHVQCRECIEPHRQRAAHGKTDMSDH